MSQELYKILVLFQLKKDFYKLPEIASNHLVAMKINF